jgi:regulator of replication initiation timing
MTDTSRNRVIGLAEMLEDKARQFAPGMPGRDFYQDVADTLRALAAENDALRAEVASILAENDALRFTLNNANAALRQAVERARGEALEEAAKWHDEQATYCARRAVEREDNGWPEAARILKMWQASHHNSAAVIRARAGGAGDE